MGDVAVLSLRSTAVSGNLKALDTSGGSASALTKASYASTGTGIRQFTPETATSVTATIPTAGAAPRDIGWRMVADINAEPVEFTAANWPVSFNAVVAGTTAGPGVTFTAIAYAAGVEIGRGSSTAFTLFASQVVTFNIAATAVTTAANPRIQVEIYANVTVAAVAISTWTIELTTNHASSTLDPGAYALRAVRSGAVTTTPTVAMARTIAAARTVTVTTTLTVGYGRALIAARTFAVTTAPTVAGPRGTMIIGLADSRFAATTTPAAALVKVPGKRAAVTTTPTVAKTRAITKVPYAVTTTPTIAAARALIAARGFTVTTTPTTRLRLDVPEVALDRITTGGPIDWAPNNGAKTISGVVRDSAGTPYVGATVRLVRETDGYIAAATTSTTGGAYSFTRDAADPYTYVVLAFEDTGTPTQGVSARGLVPV